ncbi:hypothetical protein ACC687_40660, partial [Rhizobium ruizarguesonis]
KISTPLNALFATICLLVVAALTTQGLTGQERLVFELLLSAIWLAYVLQLSCTLLSRRHRCHAKQIARFIRDHLCQKPEEGRV